MTVCEICDVLDCEAKEEPMEDGTAETKKEWYPAEIVNETPDQRKARKLREERQAAEEKRQAAFKAWEDKAGGPAFPVGGIFGVAAAAGMTLRDYFAAKMAAAWLHTFENRPDSSDALMCAEDSYLLADAMIRARKVKA
jgi:hypothetical protein